MLEILRSHSLSSGTLVMASAYNAYTWLAIAVWLSISYIPLLVFLIYAFHRGTLRDAAPEWFHSTRRGVWRIPSAVFLGWFMLFGAKGIAQFFAWDSKVDSDGFATETSDWKYPTAMILFMVSTIVDCLWLGAFFRVHARFFTATGFLVLQTIISVLLGLVYFGLSITAGAIFIVYVVFVILPMAFISWSGYRAHATPEGESGVAYHAESEIEERDPRSRTGDRSKSTPPYPKPNPKQSGAQRSGGLGDSGKSQRSDPLHMPRGKQLRMLDILPQESE